jgi:hypothetical protein
VILRPYRLVTLLLVIVASSIAVSAARADGGLGSLLGSVTGSDCGATSTPFLPWGDPASYYLAPGGGFSTGSATWKLSGGAQVVSGAPISAASPAGPQLISSGGTSLSLPAGASATSPPVCFAMLNPGIRFFAESDSGSATVHVQVIAVGLLGQLSAFDGGTAVVGSSWAPTSTFSTLFSQLDAPFGTQSIEIVITASAPVQIDDVYIDPFCSY